MKSVMIIRRIAVACFLLLLSPHVFAQANSLPANRLISPEDLVKLLQTGQKKPVILNVGPHTLFAQAHIAGSEYIGAASTEAGLNQLRKRVESLPRNAFIVLYCGCCPWSHCPNVKPADDALHAKGFSNVKVLYISDNFGTNWVEKGYPTAKGE
jgi:thiosulfate/3-mercaptopyruvate sulfurtransferase